MGRFGLGFFFYPSSRSLVHRTRPPPPTPASYSVDGKYDCGIFSFGAEVDGGLDAGLLSFSSQVNILFFGSLTDVTGCVCLVKWIPLFPFSWVHPR